MVIGKRFSKTPSLDFNSCPSYTTPFVRVKSQRDLSNRLDRTVEMDNGTYIYIYIYHNAFDVLFIFENGKRTTNLIVGYLLSNSSSKCPFNTDETTCLSPRRGLNDYRPNRETTITFFFRTITRVVLLNIAHYFTVCVYEYIYLLYYRTTTIWIKQKWQHTRRNINHEWSACFRKIIKRCCRLFLSSHKKTLFVIEELRLRGFTAFHEIDHVLFSFKSIRVLKIDYPLGN